MHIQSYTILFYINYALLFMNYHIMNENKVGQKSRREEENGMVAPDINSLKVGDVVISKHPWGIGPKDEELADGTKLSFMREMDIAAKVTGTLV